MEVLACEHPTWVLQLALFLVSSLLHLVFLDRLDWAYLQLLHYWSETFSHRLVIVEQEDSTQEEGFEQVVIARQEPVGHLVEVKLLGL